MKGADLEDTWSVLIFAKGEEDFYEGTAACGDHPGWKWTLGKIQGDAEKLRTCAGQQKCGENLRGILEDGHQISDRVCLFHGELEPPKG